MRRGQLEELGHEHDVVRGEVAIEEPDLGGVALGGEQRPEQLHACIGAMPVPATMVMENGRRGTAISSRCPSAA